MTALLCPKCDYEIFYDKDDFNYHLRTFQNRYDRSLYYNYFINNVNLNEFNKIIDYYIKIHNDKFNIYFINCIIEIVNNNFISTIEMINHSLDYNHIKKVLNSYKIDKINHISINITSCLCHIKYKHYKDKPMSMLERRLNYIICKYPKLININHNNPLIRKYPNIKFNNV